VTAWGVTLCFALALGLVACSDDEPDDAAPTTEERSSSTTTAPERPASTTTTAFDPASVEGEVEAAYLRSWDVYAEAVYDLVLDEQAFAEVYTGDYLATVTREVEERIAEKRAALVQVDHDYDVEMVDEATVLIVDRCRTHQVLIDPATKEPIEDDPDEEVVDVVTLQKAGGVWRVSRVQELE
jgi:hypothetical protein